MVDPEISHFGKAAALGRYRVRERNCSGQQATLDYLVEKSCFGQKLGLDRFTRNYHVERRLQANQAWQSLSASAPGANPASPPAGNLRPDDELYSGRPRRAVPASHATA
jgi:hypothetical protein